MEILLMPVPPMIEEAFGYSGSFRFVAFYYDPKTASLLWSDPRMTGFSAPDVWRSFTRHGRVAPFFERFNFGDESQSADRWLVLDRVKREFYAGVPAEILPFLNSVRHEIWSSECEPPRQFNNVSEDSPWLQTALTEIMEDWLDQA